MTHEFMFYSAL